MGKPAVTPESISGEALFLLRALRDGALNAEVPAGVDALFDRMTADEREARLPDMDAVLAELERAASGAPWLSADHVVLARGG